MPLDIIAIKATCLAIGFLNSFAYFVTKIFHNWAHISYINVMEARKNYKFVNHGSVYFFLGKIAHLSMNGNTSFLIKIVL